MAVPPRSKREHLRHLVEGKSKWSRTLTEEERVRGFRGWHERGYMPHCDFPNSVQFVTFRLGDSMPVSRRAEWEHLLAIEDIRERRTRLEEYLDRGVGQCWLRDKQIANLIEEALLYFHGVRYELLAWCVMPNHVHVLVNVRATPLGKMIQSWKRFIATQAEAILLERRSPTRLVDARIRNEPGRRPALQLKWQREYWDTVMRDGQQKLKAIRYIEANPVKAGLCKAPEEWQFSSARLKDAYRRFVVSLNSSVLPPIQMVQSP